MSVEIYPLKVFLEVARHLSFTAAANELNLTQPAVSAKIKSLEASLGAELFNRLGRKIELTEVGKYLLEKGPNLIDLESRLIEGIEAIKQGNFNRLRVACTQSIANGYLPEILFAYRQKYPGVDLRCLPFNTAQQIYQAISDGDADIGFSETSLAAFDDIEQSSVDSFQYCLMVASDHRLAAREWLSLRDLIGEAWVFPAETTPDGLALVNRLGELGLQLSDFLNHEIVSSPSLMSPFLSQGHYLGFASSFQFQPERKAKMLTAISLQEFPLDLRLLMLRAKSASQNVSTGPVQQFVQLVSEQRGYQRDRYSLSDKRSSVPFPSQKAVRLRSPSDTTYSQSPYQADSTETMAIAIGTQNKTIQTVTAGLVIQHLGLLEHFLPRSGRYRDTQYQIKWRDFTSGAPIVGGLQSEQLDIGILGDYPLLLSGANAKATAAKTRLVSFVASNPSGAGNTVIVPNRSKLMTLEDLRSRAIAVPFASAAHGMIMRTLARENLLSDVTLTSIDDLSIHCLTPRNATVDGYAYFAPLHDIANHRGQFRRLLENDAEQLPTFHGVVVRESFAEEHPDIVVAYLQALVAAQSWYETTPRALSLVSNWVGMDPEIVAKTLAHQRSDTAGLFLSDTKIRADWVKEHARELAKIKGNEPLADLDLETWICPDLLSSALASL